MRKPVSVFLCLCVFLILLTVCTSCTLDIDKDGYKSAEVRADAETKADIYSSRAHDRELEKDLEPDAKVYEVAVYFLNRTQNTLAFEIRRIPDVSTGVNFIHIIEALSKAPASPELEAVIPLNTKLLSANHVEDIVTVNLSSDFLEATDLLIARAALVNTLVDISGIEFVKILVEGKEVTTSGIQEGEVLGVLTRFPNNIDDILAKEGQTAGSGGIRTLDWELFFQDREGKLLLSEIRKINVLNMEYARAIVEELIKGPSEQSTGLYRAIPSDVRLLDVEVVKSPSPGVKDTLKLYFCEEFRNVFANDKVSFQTTIGSLVLSLTSLSNIGRVSINYENSVTPVITDTGDVIRLQEWFVREDFLNILGRRIRVYFSDSSAMSLVPEYRVMTRADVRIARKIISELIEGPVYESNVAVMPPNLSVDEIRVWVDQKTAYVDLPHDVNLNQMGTTGETMAIYAIVHSLTDPVNTRNIEKVQFLVGGKVTESVGHLSLTEPFVRNPALVNDK